MELNINQPDIYDPDTHRSRRDPAVSLAVRRSSRIDQLQSQIERLLANLRIAVVYGGDKSEEGAVIYKSHNPRDWKSYHIVARDIAKSLQRLGAHNVFLFPDDMRLATKLLDNKIDFVWLNTGGVQGLASVSHAAAMLEMLGVPYLGHDPLTSAVLDSKHAFKNIIRGAGIPTADFITWHCNAGRFDPSQSNRYAIDFGDYAGPFIVKPVCGRASLHVEYVETVDELSDAVQKVFELTRNFVLVEKYLSGREFCIAACGPVIARNGILTSLKEPFVFGAVERVLLQHERIFTSMDKSPITGDRVICLDPNKDHEILGKLHEIAQKVVEHLNIDTLVRLDVRADASGNLFVLETNPKPDLKAPTKDGVTSLIAMGLPSVGMTYDDLILSLFADRIDVLMSRWRGGEHHMLSHLGSDVVQAGTRAKATGNG